MLRNHTHNTSKNLPVHKINKRNTKRKCEICLKSTIGALNKSLKHANNKVIDVVLVSLLLTFNRFHTLLLFHICITKIKEKVESTKHIIMKASVT